MAQNVLVGAADNALGSQTYGNQSMVDYEEQAVGSNGFGVRMAAPRIYHNYFTQVMTSGGLDETRLKSGHTPVISITHPAKVKSDFTFHKFATTTEFDSDAKAALTRIAGEPFDQAVSGGSLYGGINAALLYMIFVHEIDRETPHPGLELYPGDTAADYIASYQKLWNFWNDPVTGIAVLNGVSPKRIRWVWTITVSNLSTADTFYPGDKYVDVIGFDPYASSPSTSFATLCSAAFTYARKKNKPIAFPEINCQHTGDSTALQNWWIDVGTQINALDIPVEFLCIWPSGPSFNGSSYYEYNINKVADTNGHAFPDAHAGFLTFINSVGGNAIRTSVGQALPAIVTGGAGLSSTDGTQETLTWTPNAGGDNVTKNNIYRAAGWVTSGGVVVHTTSSASPQSYTDSGLTAGGKYTYWISALNVTGEGPLSAPIQIETNIPSVNNGPIISSASAAQDGTNQQQINFTAAASSPLSRPLTYNWTLTNSQGVVIDTFSGASVSRTYQTAGNFTWSLIVADNGTPSLTAPDAGSVQLVFGSTTTPLCGYDLSNFQPGVFVEMIGQGLIPIFTAQDAQIGGLLAAVGDIAEMYDSNGQTFDPKLGSTSNTANLASGLVLYAKLKCHSPSISSINTTTTQAQIGTGSVVAVLNSGGAIVTVDGTPGGAPALFSGTNVDAWLTHAAGDTTYQLDTAISGLPPNGSDIYLAVFSPPTTVTQYAKFVGAPGPNGAAVANGNSAQPIFGSITGQSTIPSPLPFGSNTQCPCPLFIVNA